MIIFFKFDAHSCVAAAWWNQEAWNWWGFGDQSDCDKGREGLERHQGGLLQEE